VLLLDESPVAPIASGSAGGGRYLEIEPDRTGNRPVRPLDCRCRGGGSTLGGEIVTTTVEGRERYGVIVRYPRDLRDNPQAIASDVLVSAGGAMVPLGELAAIRVTQGPLSIRTENTEPVAYLYAPKTSAGPNECSKRSHWNRSPQRSDRTKIARLRAGERRTRLPQNVFHILLEFSKQSLFLARSVFCLLGLLFFIFEKLPEKRITLPCVQGNVITDLCPCRCAGRKWRLSIEIDRYALGSRLCARWL
jgi:hypothetical protein